MKTEPAMIVAAIMAILAVGISFGLGINEDQVDKIRTALEAVLVLIGGLIIRQSVVPTSKLD